MLKAVSSITNAIGALNYKGTWNASTNTPTLASGVGTKGDYYVVSVAGSTALDGISNWGIGDWAVFNGTAWQRVEGGADLNGVNLSVSGTTTLSGLTASTALALDASKNVVSVTNTGSGNNVLATSPQIATPTLTGDVQMSTGNLVVGTSGKGIDFSITPSGSGTMTSELFSDYEEGTWTATLKGSVSDPTTPVTATGRYTRVGRLVTITVSFDGVNTTGAAGDVTVTGIPFNNSTPFTRTGGVVSYVGNFTIANKYVACGMDENATAVYFNDIAGVGFGASLQHSPGGGRYLRFAMTYYAA